LANHSITISNSIRAFGPAPTTKWGSGTPYTMTWGTSKWGEGTQDLIVACIKVISNDIASDTALINSVRKVIQTTILLTEELSIERLTDGNGYSYIFPGNTTNAESRVESTYSTATAGSLTYSSQAAGTTTWS
jgi:hypothetical protein